MCYLSPQLTAIFQRVDDWQFDSFALEEASGGRPLSCLGFHLLKRSGVMKHFHLDETKLARFLIRIEEGYPNNPYHSRTHAADVLRSLHTVLNKGGVMTAVVSAAFAKSNQPGQEDKCILNDNASQVNVSQVNVSQVNVSQVNVSSL